MSLNSIMSSATTGLMAAQTGLRTVSDNIANLNTPGYVRKLVQQQPLISAGLGVGVDVAKIVLASDQFLQKASLRATASAGQASAIADTLDRAQGLFGDPSLDNSFFSRLDTLYAAFSSAVDDPSSTVRRGSAVNSVVDYLNDASRISTSLKAMGDEVDSRIAAKVQRANQLLVEIDSLNADITRARVSGGDGTGSENLQIQRINELSTLIDISLQTREAGGVVVRASDGMALAGQGGPAVLSYSRTAGASGEITVTMADAAAATSMRARLTGGELQGLLDLRDRELPAISNELGEFVSRAVDELNRAHNAAAAVPPPTSLTGRDTGLDLPTAVGGFTGATTLAIVSPAGMLQRRIDIDFDAGTMSVDGGAGVAFTPASFLASLNSALGAAGSASFTDGVLSLTAAGGAGLAFSDDPANPSSKTGRTLSHFFGLNDLVSTDGFGNYETGLRTTDAHGFTAGGEVTFRVAGADGSRIRDITVAVPAGGTMQNLLDALNAPGSGVGAYGQFALDANGSMSFTSGAAGSQLTVLNDDTERGAGGPSMTELFGIGHAQRSGRAERYSVRSDIAANSSKLGLATLDLGQAAAGRPVLSAGDGRGALLLARAGDVTTRFEAVGSLSAVSMTVSRYGAELAGSIGRRADAAASRRDSAEAVAEEATARRASVEGVNLDEELVNMTTYQQAFNASARVIQASRDMYDILLTMIGT
ncbi:MAG TPA: flagellar hook-associated protein FlgK [Caulobacter sp.]|nr:flagellar hook-associated protein FlgK [Caulobacter sp.]